MKNYVLILLSIFCLELTAQNGNPRLQPTKPFAVFYKSGKLAYLAPGTNNQVLKMQGDSICYWGTDNTGSVTDGNYGDVTVSGSGASWTINANAITTGKINAAAVDSSKLAASAVTSTRIANGAVWMSKISQAGATSGQTLLWGGSSWSPGFLLSGSNQRIPYFNNVNTLTNTSQFTFDAANTLLNIGLTGNNSGYCGYAAGSTSGATYLRSGNSAASTAIEGGTIVMSRAGTTAISGNTPTAQDYIGAVHAQAFYSSAFREAATIQFRGDSTASTFYSGNISFWTSDGTATAAERMRLNKVGNLGIGNTNPLSKLHVSGSVRANGIIATPPKPTATYVQVSGTAGTATVNYGGDMAFSLTLQSGSVPNGADYVLITFASPLPTGIKPIVSVTAGDANSSNYVFMAEEATKSNTSFRIYRAGTTTAACTLNVLLIGAY